MKKDIHPKYHDNIKVVCACGNEIETGSTLPEIKTEICSNCHPFYTGKQKLVDSSKRVEKFQAKMEASKNKAGVRGKKAKRAAKNAAKEESKAEQEATDK